MIVAQSTLIVKLIREGNARIPAQPAPVDGNYNQGDAPE